MYEYLHVNIIENTLKIISVTSSGPEALTFVFELIYVVSFEHIEHMKDDLKSIKLVDFTG